MTDFYKFIKFEKILENIRPPIQAVSPKAYIGVMLSIRILKGVHRVLIRIGRNISKMTDFCIFKEFHKISKNLPRVKLYYCCT